MALDLLSEVANITADPIEIKDIERRSKLVTKLNLINHNPFFLQRHLNQLEQNNEIIIARLQSHGTSLIQNTNERLGTTFDSPLPDVDIDNLLRIVIENNPRLDKIYYLIQENKYGLVSLIWIRVSFINTPEAVYKYRISQLNAKFRLFNNTDKVLRN